LRHQPTLFQSRREAVTQSIIILNDEDGTVVINVRHSELLWTLYATERLIELFRIKAPLRSSRRRIGFVKLL
jgi:hypothetical protein